MIDGDTIVIDRLHIRLAGIDAPELDHPWGQQSKWALVKLCKDQIVTARIKPEMSYDRLVAECFLPDGRDLAAELVKAGLALDWPKFSGGKYRHLEVVDARQKLWRAQLRQRGLVPPGSADDLAHIAAQRVVVPSGQLHSTVAYAPARQAYYRFGWLFGVGLFTLLVGCQLIGTGSVRGPPVRIEPQAPAFGRFEVTAGALNVRKEPQANADVVAQIERGTQVAPQQASGRWYGIAMPDGGTGWVHSNYLSPVGE